MWKRWKNNSRHCVVWLRLRISGKCTTALREARAERDSNTARLDFPVRTETAECVVIERIESQYRNLFDRINQELRAEKKRADDKIKDELNALQEKLKQLQIQSDAGKWR